MNERCHAEVVEPARDGEVEVGERVTVLDLITGETSDYRIVRPGDAAGAEGDVSSQSPLGSALLGRHVGDVVEVALARGTTRLEVVEIDG